MIVGGTKVVLGMSFSSTISGFQVVGDGKAKVRTEVEHTFPTGETETRLKVA
jgi:hypothetical protein